MNKAPQQIWDEVYEMNFIPSGEKRAPKIGEYFWDGEEVMLQGHSFVSPVMGLQPLPFEIMIPDSELTQFLQDARELKTSVEHKWRAWLESDEGTLGTGSTEIEAIKNLAAAHRAADGEQN